MNNETDLTKYGVSFTFEKILAHTVPGVLKKYIKLWDQSRASAAIVNDSLDVELGQGRALMGSTKTTS